MAAAISSKKQDTRKPNAQPNHLQATLAAVISFVSAGVVNTGTVQVPQNDKLSDKGNVTFNGGIRKGWIIDGDPVAVLGSISAMIEGITLKVAEAGVHASKAGNDTVCLTGIIELPSANDETPLRYMVQVWATYRRKHGDYTLSVKGNPFALPQGTPGPITVGEVVGFELATV